MEKALKSCRLLFGMIDPLSDSELFKARKCTYTHANYDYFPDNDRGVIVRVFTKRLFANMHVTLTCAQYHKCPAQCLSRIASLLRRR